MRRSSLSEEGASDHSSVNSDAEEQEHAGLLHREKTAAAASSSAAVVTVTLAHHHQQHPPEGTFDPDAEAKAIHTAQHDRQAMWFSLLSLVLSIPALIGA